MLPLDLRIIWIAFLTQLVSCLNSRCPPCFDLTSPHVQNATYQGDVSAVGSHEYTCTGNTLSLCSAHLCSSHLKPYCDQCLSVTPPCLPPGVCSTDISVECPPTDGRVSPCPTRLQYSRNQLLSVPPLQPPALCAVHHPKSGHRTSHA